jgi:hypothetical protein
VSFRFFNKYGFICKLHEPLRTKHMKASCMELIGYAPTVAAFRRAVAFLNHPSQR